MSRRPRAADAVGGAVAQSHHEVTQTWQRRATLGGHGDARIRLEMRDPEITSRRQVQGDVAALAGVIERLAGDLAIGEEPSNFAAVLDAAAPRE